MLSEHLISHIGQLRATTRLPLHRQLYETLRRAMQEGRLQPGDRVDIYWTGSTENGSSEVTRLIGTAVEVVAVNRDEADGLSDGAIMKRTITVAADPQQIAILAQGNATGRLVMSLVGMGDDSTAGFVEVASAQDLAGIERISFGRRP